MEFLDVFNQDPFTAISLSAAVQRNPYPPNDIASLGVFQRNPIRTTAVSVEMRQGKLVLIPLSERGTQGTQRTTEKRNVRYFETGRLMHSDTVRATEMQNIRAFGETSVLMQYQEEVARRLSGPTGLLASVDYTKEYMMLAAIQGYYLDPKDGSIRYNWFDEFGFVQQNEIPFNLSAGTANSLRPLCNSIRRTIARKAQGAFRANTPIYALCGDDFYDAFVNHPDVIRTFVNWSDATNIRDGDAGAAFDRFPYSGIIWMNYRGSDDNTTIKIPNDKVKFFPKAPGIFQEALAPGESVDWMNQPGQDVYVLPIPDRDRRMWWQMEVYSYPLYLCTRPEVLLTGRAGV